MLNGKTSFRFFIFLGIGILLAFLSIGKLDLRQLISVIQQGHYTIAIPIFAISVIGYWFRSLRWKLVLESIHETPSTKHLFAALSMGYAVNFATPRLGEIVRCVVLHKTAKVPIEKALMSVVVERVFDIICLLGIVFVVASVNYKQSSLFFDQQIYSPLYTVLIQIPWLLLLLIVLFLLIIGYVVIQKLSNHNRVVVFIKQSIESFKRIFFLNQRIRFLVYTFSIWSCYYLMTYLWFFTFPETSVLGLKEALVIMAVGSIGRSVPIQGGGMGAYHFLVSNAFALFGVSLLVGNAMAIVIHGAQMLLTIVLGFICWMWMLYFIKKQK
jgi:uncharacterized protein (TIRG00374 family)